MADKARANMETNQSALDGAGAASKDASSAGGGRAFPRGPDRRKRPTNPLSLHSLLYGRRRKPRRVEDRAVHYYVDRYGPASLALFLLSLLFSVADAFITLELIEAGGRELNPVMLFFLQWGIAPFLTVKFGLTISGLLFLLLHKEYHLFGWRIRGKHVMVFALGLYAVLILYESTLLRKIWAEP